VRERATFISTLIKTWKSSHEDEEIEEVEVEVVEEEMEEAVVVAAELVEVEVEVALSLVVRCLLSPRMKGKGFSP